MQLAMSGFCKPGHIAIYLSHCAAYQAQSRENVVPTYVFSNMLNEPTRDWSEIVWFQEKSAL